jgi:uncharacterized membrane protein YfcA
MKHHQTEEQIRHIGLVLFGICLVLILVAMFGSMGPRGNSVSGFVTTQSSVPVSFEFTVSQGVRLMLLGAFSGIIGGMMGMGGGVVKVSGLLIIFDQGLLLARSVSIITNVFIYGAAAYKYMKNKKLMVKEVAELMIPGAILGVVFGFVIGNILYVNWLQVLLGVFALFSGASMARKIYLAKVSGGASLSDYGPQEYKKESKLKVAGAGFPMGTVMGLFGISGGVFGIPYQKYFLRMPIKNAIANTSVTSFVASAVAIPVVFWQEAAHGQYGVATPIIMALWIIPGNILGSLAGSHLTGFLPTDFIRMFYVFIMLVIGVRLFF